MFLLELDDPSINKTCINAKYIAGCKGHIIQNTILNVYTFITYDKIEQTTKTDIRRTKHTKRNMTRNLIILFRQTIKYFKCMFQEILLIGPKTMYSCNCYFRTCIKHNTLIP